MDDWLNNCEEEEDEDSVTKPPVMEEPIQRPDSGSWRQGRRRAGPRHTTASSIVSSNTIGNTFTSQPPPYSFPFPTRSSSSSSSGQGTSSSSSSGQGTSSSSSSGHTSPPSSTTSQLSSDTGQSPKPKLISVAMQQHLDEQEEAKALNQIVELNELDPNTHVSSDSEETSVLMSVGDSVASDDVSDNVSEDGTSDQEDKTNLVRKPRLYSNRHVSFSTDSTLPVPTPPLNELPRLLPNQDTSSPTSTTTSVTSCEDSSGSDASTPQSDESYSSSGHEIALFSRASYTADKTRAYNAMTDLQFDAAYARATANAHRKPPPKSFCIFPVDGLRARLDESPDLEAFLSWFNERDGDCVTFQNVQLRESIGNRAVIHQLHRDTYEQLCNLLPNFNFFGNFSDTGGQITGVRKDREHPNVCYHLDTQTQDQGVVFLPYTGLTLLEFTGLTVLVREALDTNQSPERVLRRRTYDKIVHEYIQHHPQISSKTLLYLGDLNVCDKPNDVTQTLDYWQQYVDPNRDATLPLPTELNDRGLSLATNSHRQIYTTTVTDGQLCDPGRNLAHNQRGINDRADDTFRTVRTLISRDIEENGLILRCETPGETDGTGVVGQFGSTYSPVMLMLDNDWCNQLKGFRQKVYEEKMPYYKRKILSRKVVNQPHYARLKYVRDKRARLMSQWLVTSAFLHTLDGNPIMSPEAQYFTVHRDGEIHLPAEADGTVHEPLKFNALWDTGASNANYMSSQFYEKHKELLEPHSINVESSVTLGDKKTILPLDTAVVLPVQFTSDMGVMHEAEIPFMILQSTGRDVIIGMPSLISDFGVLFKSMIDEAVDKYTPTSQSHDCTPPPSEPMVLHEVKYDGTDCSDIPLVPEDLEDFLVSEMERILTDAELLEKNKDAPEGCSYPWSTDFNEKCPEDDMIPEAVTNIAHLEHLTQSYDDELSKFYSSLDEHVTDDFLKLRPGVKDLLKKYVGCFVKKDWVGLRVADIIVKFKETLPDRLKPYTPRIPEHLKVHSEKEMKRMLEYFYEKCDSPWASPLTVAPKASDPYIRLCVNLRKINSYVDFGHFPIPNVKGTLDKLIKYKYFCEFDLKSSFHQLPLDYDSSMKLSVQTPWGQFRPKFVPEGLCQASQNLQEVMESMFGDLGDWCILLFDNVLIGGVSHEDIEQKMALFLERCDHYNVYLKLSKSFVGLKEVKFFGYNVCDGKYYLEGSRSEAIDLIKFPSHKTKAANMTAMRSFLGQTRIFQPHVPDYTTYSAPLEKLTSAAFDWDPETWKLDYKSIFDEFKAKLKEAMTLFMPDFNKEWILRTDASNTGYGGVLYQVDINAEGKRVYEPLTFISRKWSDPATRWDTFSQECFGIFACVKECSHLLRGKPFIIETDHSNLRWMESSSVPKIIRQHLYLRTFTTWVRHIAGKSNTADYWSRLLKDNDQELRELTCDDGYIPDYSGTEFQGDISYHLSNMYDSDPDFWNDKVWLDSMLNCITELRAVEVNDSADTPEIPGRTPQELFDSVHGGKMLHQGVRRTWLLLNKLYPAHAIPISKVQDMVDECATCQKFRLGLRDQLNPVSRVLEPQHHRCIIGVDTLSITPESKDGYKAIITMVNHYTHHVFLYPVKKYDSESLSNALMAFISNFGLFDEHQTLGVI